MQTQTQRPNCVCVCVSLRASVSVCVCMLSAMMSLLPESASPSAEMKELNSNSKPNETKTEEENGEKIRRRGCMRARKEEEMKRNCRGTNAGTKKPSHSREICFYRLIFLLWAAENVKNNNNRNNQCGVNEWICHSPCSDARSSSSLFTLKICSSAASAPPHSSPIHDITHQPSDWPAGMLGRDWSSRAEEEKERRRRRWCWVISEETSWPVTESSSSESGGQTLSLTERNINVLKMKNQLKLSSDQLSWDIMCAAPTRASWKQQHRPRGRVPTTTQKTFRRF